MKIRLGLYAFVAAVSVMLNSAAVAQVAPSPAMIEQFKQLPKDQQQQLAAQYGIDLNLLNQTAMPATQPNQVEQLTPKHELMASAAVVGNVPAPTPGASERFGMRMFDASISTFAPVNNMPVPDDYVLGADDSVNVQLYGKESASQLLVIDREGLVQLDGVGPLQLAGLRYRDAAALIKSKIAEAKIGVEAAVSMGKLRTINVFIAGEAKFPGMYAVSAMTTVTQALFVSGGVSDIGSLRDIRINRSGHTVGSFDLYDLLLKGDNRQDLNLKHGDVLFIAPVGAQVKVEGLVNRPAVYELKAKERLQDVLAMAGGHKANAHLKAVQLQRINSNNLRDLKTLDLTEGTDSQLVMQDGDALSFKPISDRVENEVVLAGAVVRPGRYAYTSGMQLTDLIHGIWADLLPTVDLDYALVIREQNGKGDIDAIQINLSDVLGLNGVGKKAFVLQPRDVVMVFHYTEEDKKAVEDKKAKGVNNIAADMPTANQGSFKGLFGDSKFLAKTSSMNRQELLKPVIERLKRQSSAEKGLQVVTVSGQVKIPGEYPISSRTNVKDMIAAAGGLTDAAFLQRAEVSRFKGFEATDARFDIENLIINLENAIQGATSDNVVLQSRDRLNIFAKPEWAEDRTVEIAGEVRFPGKYALARGEKLSDLIVRAGGFTDDAFPFGTVFTRQKVKEREQQQFNRLLQQLQSDIAAKAVSSTGSIGVASNPEQSMALIKQLESTEMVGRLVVDMAQIEAGNPDFDVALEQGDKLIIPRKTRSVTVIGEVQYPSSHSYDSQLSIKDYLSMAGNPRKRADEDRIYIIRANGSVVMQNQGLFSIKNGLVAPGDTIIVPLDVEYKDSLSLWAQVSQIVYQSAVAIAAVKTL